MYSAFGVDHGEVSKGLKLSWVKRPRKLTRAQIRTQGQGTGKGTRTEAVTRKLKNATETPVSIAGTGRAAGRGITGTGAFMQNHPGVTGSALVGGGGAAAYHHLKQKEPKRRSS
jgi:hypothetical protein